MPTHINVKKDKRHLLLNIRATYLMNKQKIISELTIYTFFNNS